MMSSPCRTAAPLGELLRLAIGPVPSCKHGPASLNSSCFLYLQEQAVQHSHSSAQRHLLMLGCCSSPTAVLVWLTCEGLRGVAGTVLVCCGRMPASVWLRSARNEPFWLSPRPLSPKMPETSWRYHYPGHALLTAARHWRPTGDTKQWSNEAECLDLPERRPMPKGLSTALKPFPNMVVFWEEGWLLSAPADVCA